MTMNTTPPQNLARHFYDIHRADVADQGGQLPHWYQLPAEIQANVQKDVDKFWTALRNAEQEQQQERVEPEAVPDIRGVLESAGADQAEGPESTPSPVNACNCPSCLLEAVLRMLNPPTEGPPAPPAERRVRLVPLDVRRWGVTLSADEEEKLEKPARRARPAELELIVARIDPGVLTGDAPAPPPIIDFGTPWITEAGLERAFREEMRRDRERQRWAAWVGDSLKRLSTVSAGTV
ncbi:hypothetical protein EV284_6428 [Streptomyces sp. BK022]|uniref:hypothetical protein n=1 Tax=Streptomyces sp. BK022 TaxID=2512123 RepID=UPI0010295D7E|nr:hypothetical protein [Streptomyces sp. BK022]RZU28262.1 hypothetical protein EV284_6428 [Streptomyces sp. BK022]